MLDNLRNNELFHYDLEQELENSLRKNLNLSENCIQ